MSDHAIYPLDIVIKKRDGAELTKAEIEHFIHAVVLNGEQKLAEARGEKPATLSATDKVTDAQIAAFLMAVFQRGLSPEELANLTTAMRFSGETFDAAPLHTFTVDKHSTGGVGDKSSLLIAPIVAAAGLDLSPSISVPMISGRSLGHTGGTLDKLETIPGFDTQISMARFAEILRECHASLVGQTPRLVPADRILYAMRDHTGTVESPFLITASIMSKKLAESLNALVLDVKVGSGAFMPTYEKSKFLAELMVSTGERAGTRTAALLTTMDEPLGRFSGNWMEVWECVDILQNRRHPMSADLIELSNILSGWMLYFGGKTATPEAGAKLADDILRSGAAYKSWLQIVAAHQGDTSIFNDPAAFHQPKATRVLKASRAGYLAGMDCKEVGWAVQRLGAGRAKPGDPVSAHAGIESHAKLGDKVEEGQPIFTLFSEDAALLDEPYRMLEATVEIANEPRQKQPLIREIITKENIKG
ncbi:thymidine phosphorylase [Granulicella mallensis]|uniref:thymidine phosphorylase n=1 Tax=Granulicella mallensis (strain ATCC BAA-1857 / DSM 23137 / MP5ACTX8) TaxID=682795 RepID=G8NW12_GRAMM|nr:thymidine phosphorylase [Granulicella mallensis]AEU35432.1 pyrimidine-nucleoside phosphorylase [Granulicella mallensis MP5ACTX8]